MSSSLLSHMVNLLLVFCALSILICIVDIPIFISSNIECVPHPHNRNSSVISCFVDLSYLTRPRWNLNVVFFFCIFLIAKDDESSLRYSLVNIISSIGNTLLSSLTHFNWIIYFLSLLLFLCILHINPLSDI